jgi:predicted nucleotide-binding protein (sugar kinase/HSP70/actin superfamily)
MRASSQPLVQVQLSVHSAETVPAPAPLLQDRKTKVPLNVGERRLINATCEKGTVEDLEEMKQIKAGLDSVKDLNPNFVEIAAHEVFKFRNVKNVADPLPARAWLKPTRERIDRMKRRENLKIGIPRVLNSYVYAPLFNGYLQSLGILSENIVYSDYTSAELYRAGASRGAIDPCFPAKIGIAHVYNLVFVKGLRKQFDLVFFPMVDVLHTPLVNLQGSNACPTVTACPNTVKAAFTKEADVFAEHGIQYLDPLLNLNDRKLFAAQMYKCWAPILGLSVEENIRAIEAGYRCLQQYETSIRKQAREVLEQLEREDRIGIVMLGRPYHHDPGLNHEIMEEFQKLGYPIFSQSTLPLDEDVLEKLFGEEVRAGIINHPLDISDVWKNSYSASTNHKIWAAKFTARHPNLVGLEVSNFKCGHDAPIYGVVEGIIEHSGTPYFCFKDLDENKPAGSIKIRVETIDYFLRRYREVVIQRRQAEQAVEGRLRAYEEFLQAEVIRGSVPA